MSTIDHIRGEIERSQEKFKNSDPKVRNSEKHKARIQKMRDLIASIKDNEARRNKAISGRQTTPKSELPSQKARAGSGMVMNKRAGELTHTHHHEPGPVHRAPPVKTYGKFTKCMKIRNTNKNAQAESVEQIDELSNEVLSRYKKAASDQASAADKAGDFKKGNKRFSGIIKATKKQFDNDMKKEEVEIDESNDHYEKAEQHKDDAESAKEAGDHFSYHMHMADHHGAMAEWHYSKGRNSAGDKHHEKAADHEMQAHAIKSMKKEEVELDEVTSDLVKKARDAAFEKGKDDQGHRFVKKAYEKGQKESDAMAKKMAEDVAANNVGGGAIAGTQGDAGKKVVMTKEPLKRKKLTDFKSYAESKSAEEYFDIIEEIIEQLALSNKIDSEQIWEELESIEDEELLEYAIDAKGHKSSEGGLTQKGVDYYNRKTGGNLKTAVTTPPSKLKPGSKAAKRRKSFCARMGGMKKRLTSAKTANDPDSRINKALRKWNC